MPLPASRSGRPPLSSLHTHTLFCDGRDDVETMCRAAFDKGLCAIGFSAHGPLFKKTGIKTSWHISDERLDAYIGEVRSARLRWEGKLAVYLGLEVDYIKGLRSARDPDIQALPLDYIIGSVHYITPANGAELFTVDGPAEELERGVREGFGGDGEAMMHAYWDAAGEMIALGGFDILGHIDLVKKNNQDGRWFAIEEACRGRAAETARLAAAAGLTVELNTGGLNRRITRDTYPSPSFLRLFRERRVPALITADAHRAEDLDGHYDVALQTLREAGYTEHPLFRGKKNGKPLWEFIRIEGP
ncbi:MAG: histidinol-phosphatase [Treponema sp.]|jgi:histidinol-phosphatase (PHP family)|nr:histidinol-phosphatase [Treponema sp.]